MKKQEFKDIEVKYIKETKRWESLKVGQEVYLEMPRFFDIDYHLHILKEINVDDRHTMALDLSVTPNKVVKLSSFSTRNELKERGVEIVKLNDEELEIVKKIKN